MLLLTSLSHSKHSISSCSVLILHGIINQRSLVPFPRGQYQSNFRQPYFHSTAALHLCNHSGLRTQGLSNGLFNTKYITICFQTVACFHKYHNIALENGRLSNNINTIFLCLETSTKVFGNCWHGGIFSYGYCQFPWANTSPFSGSLHFYSAAALDLCTHLVPFYVTMKLY